MKKTNILHHRLGVPAGAEHFDQDCTLCPRLAKFRAQAKRERPDYHCRPVAPFGADNPKLLIVGLAPGMHGANRTGRPFTGDHAGILLYATLHKFGLASQPTSTAADDPLRLLNCRITNAVKCVPPENKPTPEEIKTCNRFLAAELQRFRDDVTILALGQIAHQAVLSALMRKRSAFAFAHGAVHDLGEGKTLIDSYHCSRYNTQTGRLTQAMFEQVFATVNRRLQANGALRR